MRSQPIYIVCGDKGGVGKTMVSLALAHRLTQRNSAVLLVETDTSNPDVWRCHEKEPGVESKLFGLDDADGWINLINLGEAHPERAIAVNTAARSGAGVTAHGDLLNGALAELDRPLVALWVINRQRDSVELLKRFLAALPAATVHVLRNLYFGDAAKFERYNQSSTRQAVEGRGGLSLNFPDLADRVADDLLGRRLSVARALQDLPLGNRAELRRWEKACAAALDAVLDGAHGGVREAAA